MPWIQILKTIIKEDMNRQNIMETKQGLPPVHLDEIANEYILPSVGLSVTAAAKALGVFRQMFHECSAKRRGGRV